MSMIISPQGDPRESNFMGKFQEISLACQGTFKSNPDFRPVHKPGFVHIIC